MRIAKSYKITITLIVTFILSLAMAFGMMNFSTAKAATATATPTNYFEFSTDVSGEFKDSALVSSVKKGDAISFVNQLVISDLAIEMQVPNGLTANVSITADSYYVHGNEKVDGETVTYETQIVNKIAVVGDGAVKTLKIAVDENGYVTADGTPVSADKFYRVKCIAGMAVGKIEIEFDGAETASEFKLLSVDQKASDTAGAFKQTFKLDDSGKIEKLATPRITVQNSFYTQTAKGEYKAIKIVSTGANAYSIDAKAYSLLGGVSNSSLYVKENSALLLETNTKKPTEFKFKNTGDVNIVIMAEIGGEKVECETIPVTVIGKEADTTAPVYKFDAEAVRGFEAQLKKQYFDAEKNKSVALGSTLELPSLEDLVFDDSVSYDDLKATIYYMAKTEGSSTNFKFDLDEVGEYTMYVAFADQSGNAMEKEDFIKIDETDENKFTEGKYKDFIFRFVVNDDADIKVSPAIKESVGYKGVSYTVSKFKVDANECTLNYKLYYSKDVNADPESEKEGVWVEIPKASSVKKDSYVSNNGFTYDQVKEFAYNGTLTFKPIEFGAYKIVCTATSDVSPRTDSAYSVVKVEKEPAVVKVDTKWLQNNVWSVVFLSIGTLCLIGIVVLLFVKPKDTDNE